MAERWSTAGWSAAERVAAWEQVAGEAWVPVSVLVSKPEDFAGTVTATEVGALGVSDIASSPQQVRRTAQTAGRVPGDRYFLNLPLDPGATVSQDGRTAVLAPGDFTVVDSARPFELRFERPFRQVTVALPHDLLAPRLLDATDVTARAVRVASGVGAVASAAIQALTRTDFDADRAGGRALGDHLAGLVALALGDVRPPVGSVGRALLLRAALDSIDRSLSDATLNPQGVARSINVSVRYLHDLFTDHGESFGRTLTRRRLELAVRLLADPAQGHRPIADIAAACGFADPSYFARRFKAAYGIPPQRARRRTIG